MKMLHVLGIDSWALAIKKKSFLCRKLFANNGT